MPPEVYGAVMLACRAINRAADCRYRSEQKRKRKLQEKAQKHLQRAERYQARRPT